MHYYKFNIGDYRSHTARLTLIENHCYRTMLDEYYLTERPLQTDIKKLARILGLAGHETEITQVLEDFFIISDEGWRHKRVDKEIADYKKNVAQAKAAGEASAAKRKQLKKMQQTGEIDF